MPANLEDYISKVFRELMKPRGEKFAHIFTRWMENKIAKFLCFFFHPPPPLTWLRLGKQCSYNFFLPRIQEEKFTDCEMDLRQGVGGSGWEFLIRSSLKKGNSERKCVGVRGVDWEEERRWKRGTAEGVRRKKMPVYTDNVRVMAARGYFYILRATLKANVHDNRALSLSPPIDRLAPNFFSFFFQLELKMYSCSAPKCVAIWGEKSHYPGRVSVSWENQLFSHHSQWGKCGKWKIFLTIFSKVSRCQFSFKILELEIDINPLP